MQVHPRSGVLEWRNALALTTVCLIASFCLHQLPYIRAGLPLTLGADGDTWSHVALQIDQVKPEVFQRDPEIGLNRESRPRFEAVLHYVVGWIAVHVFGGDFIVANLVGFWFIHGLYLLGCVRLGHLLTRSWTAALLVGLACSGLSRAVFSWWGMPLGGVVPHDIGMALVPWSFLLYFERLLTGRSLVPAFVGMGIATNLYPLHPAYVAGLLWLSLAFGASRNWRQLTHCALGFAVAAMPAILMTAVETARRFDSVQPADASTVNELLRSRYGYLYPQGLLHGVDRMRSTRMWIFAAVMIFATRRALGVFDACVGASLRCMVLIGTLLTFAGLTVTLWTPQLLLFLFHRISAIVLFLSYVGTAGLAAAWLADFRWARRTAGVALVSAMFCFAWYHTHAISAVRTGLPVQASPAYYEAALWAKRSTPAGSLFLIPFQGAPFYAFRVLSERPLFLHYGLGEVVLAGPAGALEYLKLENEVTRLREASTTEALRTAAAIRGIDYVILDATDERRFDFPCVFRNDRFAIYALGLRSDAHR